MNKDASLSGKLDKNIEKKLDQVEKQLELFKAVNESVLREAGITDEEMEEMVTKPSAAFTEKEKKIFEKTQKVRKELDTLRREYEIRAMIAKLRKKAAGKAGRKVGKERKKKFKRLGSKKHWNRE